jgi:hypothetical protein
VHVPVERATTTMFWGQLDDQDTFRLFRWPELGYIQEFTFPVSPTKFSNPDCRGGVGHFDWIERETAWSITGFRMRGAIGRSEVQFLWPAAPDLQHPQAHLHGVVIDFGYLNVIAEPRVFSNSFCFGYPALGANNFGEYALSVAYGGDWGDWAPNSGTSAQGGVTVDDQFPRFFSFPTVQTTAVGTHNPSDGRFGDYFTVRKNERCPNTWNATNYALLNGNTSSAHVNARYVEIKSSTHPPCP